MPANEVTSGARSVLSRPNAYDLFQHLVGAPRARARFVSEYLRAESHVRILDVGCGTGALLRYLPDVRYVGLDISSKYIEHAKSRFADVDAEFHVADVSAIPSELGAFDVAVAFGVLHHLTDDQARGMIRGVASALGTDGRFVALESALVQGQHWVARVLIRSDRGQCVRAPQGYVDLMETAFEQVKVTIVHDMLRVPYTHCVIECSRPKA